jgi:hypothetical protein
VGSSIPVEDEAGTAVGRRKPLGHTHLAGRVPHVWLALESGTGGYP